LIRLIRLTRYLWASPNTLLGLMGMLFALAGGHMERKAGVLEAWGGPLRWALGPWADVITLGHVILARDRDLLDRWRRHEHIHVRQYERWGPFFLPVYVLLGVWCWGTGRHPYRDHPFEREAGLDVDCPRRPEGKVTQG